MGLFNKQPEKPVTKIAVTKKKPTPKKKTYPIQQPKSEPLLDTAEVMVEMEKVEGKFDFTKFGDEDLITFAKLYIIYNKNATDAIRFMTKNNNLSYGYQRSLASKYLRKLRQHEDFLDICGLGYNDLIEMVDILKLTKPEKAVDILMKLNKEDTEYVSHTGEIKFTFEEDLD